MSAHTIILGDACERMRELDESSVDAVVCDPPYGLEFMGKDWDRLGATNEAATDSPGWRAGHGSGVASKVGGVPFGGGGQRVRYGDSAKSMQEWHEAWAREALRVLKPGGHLLAFGGTRTYHRLACAVEDAGFEIRDTICWLYGSGFPKSLDVAKAIDKQERGVPQGGADPTSPHHGQYRTTTTEGKRWDGDSGQGYGAGGSRFLATTVSERTAPPSDVETAATSQPSTLGATASEWQGWGTALKPAHEPVVVARKPLAGTVAGNVLVHGTGALNVDGCRIEGERGTGHWGGTQSTKVRQHGRGGAYAEPNDGFETERNAEGRWPANVVLGCDCDTDEPCRVHGIRRCTICLSGGHLPGCPVRLLDEQTGELTSGDLRPGHKQGGGEGYGYGEGTIRRDYGGDSGGASRFFYCAKSSRGERNAGLEGFEERETRTYGDRGPDGTPMSPNGQTAVIRQNVHPTVKPIELMRWLVRLVTPPGGTVLDPFTGSGTTGCACALESFDFIGVESEPEYVEIANARIGWWKKHRGDGLAAAVSAAGATREQIENNGQEALF